MKAPLLAAIIVPTIMFGACCWWAGAHSETAAQAAAPAAKPVTETAPVEPEPVEMASVPIDLSLAIEQKSIVAEFNGNARDELRVHVLNKGTTPLRVTIPLGQTFDADAHTSVVVVHPRAVEVGPGKTREITVPVAALRSSNKLGQAEFHLSYVTLPQLEPILLKAQEHQEITLGAIQTAVLALTENLPLSAVAKFTMATAALPSKFNTDPFRVETLDLLHALTLLREAHVRETRVALTIDPQLKIEAMIDPTARPLAMRYYGIDADHEWEFWRNELLNGEPSTRHYALYGIARFYPEVALQMLPRWARETRTNPVYRLAAVQALADTESPDALPILRQLGQDLGLATTLGKAATGAADYLDYQLAQTAAARNAVAFRHSSTKGRFEVASN